MERAGKALQLALSPAWSKAKHYTQLQQLEKIKEELDELKRAIVDEGDRKHALVEAVDVLVAVLSMIFVVMKASPQEYDEAVTEVERKNGARNYYTESDEE